MPEKRIAGLRYAQTRLGNWLGRDKRGRIRHNIPNSRGEYFPPGARSKRRSRSKSRSRSRSVDDYSCRMVKKRKYKKRSSSKKRCYSRSPKRRYSRSYSRSPKKRYSRSPKRAYTPSPKAERSPFEYYKGGWRKGTHYPTALYPKKLGYDLTPNLAVS